MKNRLRIIRAERRTVAGKGWSQLDVARKAHISSFRYWQIENGYVTATPDERATLAGVLNRSESDLFPASEAVAS